MSKRHNRYTELTEAGLHHWLPHASLPCSRLNEAMSYAVFPGGKRMRPVLALLGAAVVEADLAEAVPAACATEFLHASSLIFDDLPAMDDACTRRGRPALHLVFGEDVALLAALGLLNQAYAIFSRQPSLIAEAVACIGVNGMIGGQALDLEGYTEHRAPERFDSRNRKTTALLRLTLTAGAMASGASPEDVTALARCGECLGEAYQIYDDLVDCCAIAEDTGKPTRQDARHHRPSHVAEYGIETSLHHAASLVAEAKVSLCEHFGETEAVRQLLGTIDAIVQKAGTAGMVTA